MKNNRLQMIVMSLFFAVIVFCSACASTQEPKKKKVPPPNVPEIATEEEIRRMSPEELDAYIAKRRAAQKREAGRNGVLQQYVDERKKAREERTSLDKSVLMGERKSESPFPWRDSDEGSTSERRRREGGSIFYNW